MKDTARVFAVAVLGATLLLGGVAITTPARAQVQGGAWVGGTDDGTHWFGGTSWHGDDNYDFGTGWDNSAGTIIWRGKVDDKVDIYFHGSQWTADVLTGKGVGDQHARFFNTLPAQPVHVTLSRVDGRGEVHIFQQPTADNNYTVGVRIHDPQPGMGIYRIALSWQ